MNIYTTTYTPQLQQTVNSLGKYMFKHLDGAINYKKSSNVFDIWTLILYQIPFEIIDKYDLVEEKYKDVNEMIININITTYGSKIRVNLIEETPENYTVGHRTFDTKDFNPSNPKSYFDKITNSVMQFLINSLESRYQDYDFLF